MREHQLHLLIPQAAQDARDELTRTLKAADNPAAWMLFMRAVTRLLPDVLSSGRPSAEAIRRSVIGQLGFKSWQEMIEAPADLNGLAWNFSGWKAWRRAWAVVEAHPWLIGQPMTASEINTVAQEAKRAGRDFPNSLAALDAMRDAARGAAEQAKASTIAALTSKLQDAEKSAQEAIAAAAALRDQLAESASREKALAEEVGSLKGQLQVAIAEIDRLGRLQVVDEQRTPPPSAEQPGRRGWWQRLLALFGLGS